MADGNDDAAEKTKTCRFFQSKKGCKFGDECRFLHLEKISNGSESVLHEAELLARNQHGNEGQKQNIDNLQPHNDKNARNEPLGEGKEIEEREGSNSDRQGIVCKFFQGKRGCLKGDKCPFVHLIVAGESALKKSASDKSHGNTSVTPRKKSTRQRKEIPRPESNKKHSSNQLTESADLQLENYDKYPTKQNDLLVQEDKRMIFGERSGVTLLPKNNATKPEEAGKGDAHCKLDIVTNGVVTGTGGKGGSPPDEGKVTKYVKSGKGTSVSKKNPGKGVQLRKNATSDKESARGIPLQGLETGKGVLVLNNDKEITHKEFEKDLPVLQKNSGTSVVTRKRAPLPNKENVKEYIGTGKGMKHENSSATHLRGSFTLADAILSEPKRLRATEIQQLKRRFGGKGNFSEIQENLSYKIKFKPTDPDWVCVISM